MKIKNLLEALSPNFILLLILTGSLKLFAQDPASIELQMNQVKITVNANGALFTDFEHQKYALGWGDFERNGQRFASHAGSAGTFLTNVHIDKTNSIAFIIMMNTQSPKAEKLLHQLTRIMGKMYKDS